jgi:hypothetical protein
MKLMVIPVGRSLVFSRAHHSFAAEYDANKPVTLTGSVSKMAWINPHSWIYIDVKKPDGSLESWAVEAGPPGTLIRAGFTKESMVPGTVIVVNGYRAKDGALRANGRDITLPDGRLLFVGGSSPDAPRTFREPRSEKVQYKANTVPACEIIEEAQS